MPTQPTKDQLAEIGEVIANQAQEIFEYCNQLDDFCIQSIGFKSIVFGGWNRLIFRLDSGWYLSESHCTYKFIAKFNQWKKENCNY
jgi:hypothetical protein